MTVWTISLLESIYAQIKTIYYVELHCAETIPPGVLIMKCQTGSVRQLCSAQSRSAAGVCIYWYYICIYTHIIYILYMYMSWVGDVEWLAWVNLIDIYIETISKPNFN